ncbi:MAG TPA: hypothetical protein VHW09_27230 [Bryobacteraceae bacterium]|jgi:hypothetical protein|nr:hypothetical protein [Bryobacteraceae bacterium]
MPEEKPWKRLLVFVKFGDASAPSSDRPNEWNFYGNVEAVLRLEDALLDVKNSSCKQAMRSDDGKMVCYILRCYYESTIIQQMLEYPESMHAFRRGSRSYKGDVLRAGDRMLIAEITGDYAFRAMPEARDVFAFR